MPGVKYEPIRQSIDKVISRNILLKKVIFRLLDIHLLRAWHIHRELNHFVSRLVDREISVLDAGSGFGQYSWFLVKKIPGCRLTGVDISEDYVERANNFFKEAGHPWARFITCDLARFTQPDQFELVIAVDVIEHIPDDVQVLRNFYVSMKPGGMLLISTPSDRGGSDVHSDRDESFIEEHVRGGYSIREIRDKLLAAGFEKIEARYTYGRPGRIGWALAMKYPLSMIDAGKLFWIVLPFYFLLAYPFILLLNSMDLAVRHISGAGLLVTAYK